MLTISDLFLRAMDFVYSVGTRARIPLKNKVNIIQNYRDRYKNFRKLGRTFYLNVRFAARRKNKVRWWRHRLPSTAVSASSLSTALLTHQHFTLARTRFFFHAPPPLLHSRQLMYYTVNHRVKCIQILKNRLITNTSTKVIKTSIN